MAKIHITDTVESMVIKMAAGNYGAMSYLTQTIANGKIEEIDPQMALGTLGYILLLDSWGIYGSDLYILLNDLSQKQLFNTATIIRSTQLGFLSRDVLKDACSRQDYSGCALIDLPALLIKVQEQLPAFGRSEIKS